MKTSFHFSAKWVVCVPLVALILLAGCGKKDASTSERKVLYYQSAMHPWIKSDQPGRCTVCGMELTPIYEGESGIEAGGDMITLSETSIRVLNVQTTEVKTQALIKTLTVAGTIEQDDTQRRVLSAYIPGRIEKLHVNYVGAEVKAGEPLADFYSPMLLQTEREFRAIAGSTNGELRAAVVSRLRQMGLTLEQIEALPAKPADALTSQLLAPISGTVTDKSIYAGQYVQEGEKLFEIADFATMWFQFRAYEPDLPWLRVGQKVDVATPALPGQVATGVIKFLDPNLDEATRSTRVRVELENPEVNGRRLFSHRLYADGVVHLDAPAALAVPRSAIIQTGPEAVAFVAEGGGAYARRVLQLGRRGDGVVEVISGLTAGDQVVVQGNLLMDGQAEMNRAFATHAPMPENTNEAAALPALTETQRSAASNFLEVADAVTAALAADDLKAYEAQVAKVPAATMNLVVAFEQTNAWQAFLQPIAKAGHLHGATSLTEARKQFHPLSEVTVALAQALRRADGAFANVKVFRCPMTKNSFPGAPNRADWIQLQPEVRNPYYGAEMLDCGTEVKE
jgi:membrane fusion protein, copper/silver efflux system